MQAENPGKQEEAGEKLQNIVYDVPTFAIKVLPGREEKGILLLAAVG